MNVAHIFKNKDTASYIIDANKLLTEAIAIMTDKYIGSLVILEDGQPLGIVTERDVMHATAEHGEKIVTLKVSDVMSRNLVICDAEATLDHAMDLMINNQTQHRVRHLPVVRDGGEFVGVISMSDVVEALLTKTEFENKLLMNYIKNWPDAESQV